MKEKMTLQIAGYTLNLSTDQSAEYVKQLAQLLSQRIEAASGGGRYGKLDAALLVALDLLDEQVKGTARRRELEQQLGDINAMIRSGALRFVEDAEAETEEASDKQDGEDGADEEA